MPGALAFNSLRLSLFRRHRGDKIFRLLRPVEQGCLGFYTSWRNHDPAFHGFSRNVKRPGKWLLKGFCGCGHSESYYQLIPMDPAQYIPAFKITNPAKQFFLIQMCGAQQRLISRFLSFFGVRPPFYMHFRGMRHLFLEKIKYRLTARR